MLPSPQLLAKGIARRSLEEAKRFAQLVVSQESITSARRPYPLLDFTDPETITECKTMSDAGLGGFSAASLEQVPQSTSEPAHVRFSGSISTELPRNNPQVQRTGFAGWRSKDRSPSIFGKSLWDLEPYQHLAFRVKTDGRKYFVNLQTESVVYEDLHQHRLHTRAPGEWETVFIDMGAFVRTNHGEPVEPQQEMMRHKVRTIGMSLTDRIPGPFDLCISKVWASPASARMDDKEMLENEKGLQS